MHLFTASILLTLLSLSASAEKPLIHLKVSGYTLSAEVAYKKESRIRGLTYRNFMKKNSGMLFVFPEASIHSMWMVNTYIPLSVAFLDKKGMILNIIDMSPHTRTRNSAASKAKYALEMNLGWFSSRNIKAGEKITGLKKAPNAE
ncbi:DUF192 domain-containing protein [Nitrosomonadaceae bacterium]|nr:DUF192 domain-containing protein [Nitrosomonadaceae bacterium]